MVKFNNTVIICLCFFCARVWCWTCYSDNCYQRSTEKMSWSTGVSYCSYSGSIMASLHSHSENEYVRNSVCKGQECWIGLTDKYKEGKFSWVDGTPVNYQNWNSGEPNNGDGRGEDVVLMRPDGKWNDGKDYDLLYIACMKPGPTPSPTREPSYPWPTCQPTTIVPTKSPSPNATTNGCTPYYSWDENRAEKICPSSNANFHISKSYGVEVCSDLKSSTKQTSLEKSLANNFYMDCSSWCVYDYDTIMNNIQNDSADNGGYVWKKTCWKWVTGWDCFTSKRKEFEAVSSRALDQCKVN